MKYMPKFLPLFVALTAALLCGCSGQKPANSTKVNSELPESSVSSVEAAESSPESSPASRTESVSELSDTSSDESSAKSSQESSKETSRQSDEEKLQAYYESMPKEGRENVGYNMDMEYSWKVNQYKIADYNADGHAELVVQYCCGIPQEYTGNQPSAEKQGFALEVIQCEDDVIKSYRTHDSFKDYIRFAGRELSNYEICDELYIDPEGNLGIYHTRDTNYGLPFAASYQNYIISDGKIEHIIDLGVYMSPNGSEIADDTEPVYQGKTKDGQVNTYFFTSPNDEQRHMIDKDTAMDLFNKSHTIQLIEDFKIHNEQNGMTCVENMEQHGYDIREVTFDS